MSAFTAAINTPVNWDIPRGACDCHVHVYLDYDAYPMSPKRAYTPPLATEDDLVALQQFLRFDRAVIVQPSNYGTDNRATLQGVKHLGLDRARAVVVIDPAISERDLDELAKQGARGVRVNLELDGIHDPETAAERFKATAAKIRRLGWHMQTYTQLKMIGALKNQLMDLPVPLVVDHFGMAQAADGLTQPGFQALVDLVKAGNTYVKISAAYRSSKQTPDYADLTPFATALIGTNPDRIIWATDWPHPDGAKTPGRKNTDIAPYLQVNDGAILNQLPVWAPAAATRKKILVDNPARLYGFSAIARVRATAQERISVKKTVRIGTGAAYSGDRVDPAVELAEKGAIDYLVFECLGERTIALANQVMMTDPTRGYDPLLEYRMQKILPLCKAKGFKIVTNMGAANPSACAAKVVEIARALKLPRVKVAVVTGDDVLEQVKAGDYRTMENGELVRALDNKLVSANAYLGAEPIVKALAEGADVVITGRTADPALFLAPLIHEFGWAMDDWEKLGQGTLIGHLLECAAQVSGGYFADPEFKDVPNLARIGFPLAEVSPDGTAIITKVEGSGGLISLATCKEQLLYEVHDPAAYLQPDVVADFSNVSLTEIGPNRVRVQGGAGKPRPSTLKVTVGHLDGYIGEGEITYAGPGAAVRGKLGGEIVVERLKTMGGQYDEIRVDLIGINSAHQSKLSQPGSEPYEVRLRVAARTKSKEDAANVGWEVETLWTNGPAGGGGARRYVKEVLAAVSVLLPRAQVTPTVRFLES